MQAKKTAIVACPQCGKDVLWNNTVSPYRPFCSERCKLIDLGDWAAGNYSIPLSEKSDEEPQSDAQQEGPYQA